MKVMLKALICLMFVIGITNITSASMIYSSNDYSCGWENTAYSALTKKNSFEIGVNLAYFAAKGKSSTTISQINYGSGDWNTDLAEGDMVNLSNAVKAQGLNATVVSSDLISTDLSAIDLLIMVGHNGFSISTDGQNKLKTFLDNGGVLFADDCNHNPGASAFENSFNNLIYNLYGISTATMPVLSPTHMLYSSHYLLNGADFSYTDAGNGNEWDHAQTPLKGYENHPQEEFPQVPEPSVFMLIGSLFTGIGLMKRKFNI